MEEILIPAYDAAQRGVREVQACYDAPAYVRRARRVEEALESVIARCRARRDSWLLMPRILLGTLHGQTPWPALRPFLADDDQPAILEHLFALLQPRPRLPPSPTTAARAVKTLRALVGGLTRFNDRWLAFAGGVDLDAVNRVRADYNRFYLLEKECALRNPRLARMGYQPLAPLTSADLLRLLPPLPVPRLAA